MTVKEIRRSDINGKEFVFELTPDSQEPQRIFFSASSDSQYKKWLNALNGVKEQFNAKIKLEKDQIK